jgi:microcin C transport system substrate-binding protein
VALADPDPLAGLPEGGSRAALALASRLLDEAGLVLEEGVRTDPAIGKPLRLDVLAPDPRTERPVDWLARRANLLGIELRRVQMDPTAASRAMLAREFDLATLSWEPAQLPGTAERLLWHSDLADAPRSYALSGLADPAVDAAIEAMEQARDERALEAAARLFDRSFRHALAMLPLWRSDTVRLAYWDRFGTPVSKIPPSPMDRWWSAKPG